ncbi:biotin transporter BioY [Oscillospiraceae bacterium OttesenSCG-928-G22]|nr:biotin transporter BioY [Oscillospiraceae bacterium OttesenSCG-928-G22]
MNKERIRSICRTALFAALTAALSVVSVPIPISPVPISLGLFAVFLSAMMLRPREALLSQFVYLLIGFAGFPVFTGFRAGPGVLFGPTGGYLLAYAPMAFFASLLISLYSGKTNEKRNVVLEGCVSAAALTASLLLCYGSGVLWFAYTQQTTVEYAVSMTVLPFAAFDLLKIACCAALFTPVRRRFHAMGYL